MAEILSQSQIDELLNNFNSGDIDIKEIEFHEKKVKEYDFRSPKKITKETVKLIWSIYENYCRLLSSYLTSKLRLLCDVTVEQVEESIFHEYNNALEDYVLMGLINVEYPDNVVSNSQMLMEVSKSLSFVILDRLLGGSGEEYDNIRDYTDIELSLLGNLLKQIISNMGLSWESAINIKTIFDKVETNSRFIQNINYNDTVVIIVLNTTINKYTGKITICIPTDLLTEILKKAEIVSKNSKKKTEQTLVNQKEVIINSLKETNLTITGILGKTEASLLDIINMQVGDVIMLDKNAKSKVGIDVNIDGEKWFEGQWGTRKNKSVIKINKTIR